MFTPIGFAPGVPAEYYESIGQQSIADRLREAQAASNPVAPLSNAELFSSASRAASSPLLQGNSSAFVDPPSPSGLSSVSSVATPVQINQAFEDYLGRPVDTSGLEGYLSMGKSIDDIRADLAYVASQSPETKLASDVKYYEAPSDLQLTYIQGLGGGIPTFTNPNLYTSSIYKTPQSSNVETLNINPQLGTVKPTTEVGEFVGPVLPGSEKPSPTTATDLTLTPSFLTQVQAEEDVRQAFNRVLGRQPFKGSGLDYWTNELVKGNVTLADLDQAIAKGAQGDDRLAANKFLGTNYFKVADPTTVPYASLLQPTTTVTDQPSVIETYNKKAQEREEQDKPLFNTWEDLPNIDETEIQMAKDAGYQSPGAYFLAKVESTDPSLSSWRESTRQEILGSKDLKDQYEDLYKPPIGRDAEETIYQELKRQYEVANENGFGYRHESDLEAIWRREAGILAASGVKSLYDIGTRPAERSSVIEVGSRRPDYQYGEPKETINNVFKRGNDYYYRARDDEGAPDPIMIDPARILDVQEDVKTRRQQGEDESDYVYYSGIKVQVKDDPRIDLINKNTNDPVYDIELHNEWRDDPSAYNLLNKPIEVETNPYRGFNRIHTNYGVRGAADLSFQMIPDGQGGEIPFILPIYRSTKTDLTPLAMFASMFLGPYAGAIGKYLGATTVAGQAALGAGVISAGTQLVVNGKIDPGRLLASAATAGIAQTGGFTGSDIAVDAAQLAEQGLSSAQIADTLVASGVNSVTANLAGTFASAGIAVEIAPMITAGVQNMGLTALAMGELDADALTQSFLTGAGGEASSLAVDKIIGDENLQTIADATGLSKDQAGSIATSALMNGINSEVTGTNNFFDSVVQTLVVSGVSTVTANKVAAALDDTTSDKGRAAIVGATKNIMDVAGTAAWNDMDVGDALEAMAPGIIGSALSTYVRTPETTKTDDKAKVVEVDGVKVAGPADQEALAATRNQPLVGETASPPVTDDSGTTRRTVSGENNEGQPYSYTIVTDSDGNVSYSYQTTTGNMVTSATRPYLKSTQNKPLIIETDFKPVTDEGNVTQRVVTGTRDDGSPYEYAIEKLENGEVVYRYIDSNGLETISVDEPNFNELDAPVKAPGSGMRINIFGVGDSSPKDESGKFEVQEQSFIDRVVNLTAIIDLREFGDENGSGNALVGGGGYSNVSKGLPFNFLGVDDNGYQKFDINGNQFTSFVLPNEEKSPTQVLASIFSDDVFTVELIGNEDGTKTPKLNSSSAKDVLQGAVKGAQSESGSNQGAEAAEVAISIVGEAGEKGDQSSAEVIGGWLETVIDQGSKGSGSSLGGVGGGTGTGSSKEGQGSGAAGEGAGSGGTGVGGAGPGGTGVDGAGSGGAGIGSGTEGGGSGAGGEGSGTGGSDVGTGPGVSGQGEVGPGTGQDGTGKDGDGKRGTGGGSAPVKTTKKAEGIGGIPMFTSTPYEETDFEHQSLYTKGKVKPFEGVLDEFMRRFESESSAPDQMTTEPESKMDSDYFVYGSQTDIDDVLGQAPPNTIPSLNVPSFGMRSGGLVPPFAGGGPLTMAAGKLRKDYRQGDAVEGPGDGQSDDIPAMLADGEFVIPADVVAALGNGSNKAGADKLYDMMHNIRRQARQGNPKDLPKPAKSPLQYITRR
jgi:hypothetical protein